MNRTTLVAALTAVVLGAASVTASAAALANPDGTLNISGAVSDTTCNVNGNIGGDINVALQRVPTASLAAANDVVGAKSFTINLTGCSAATDAKAPSIRFDTTSPTVDAVNGTLKNMASNGATHVDLQVLDGQDSNSLLNIATGTPKGGTAIANGAGSLTYTVRYHNADGTAATAGAVQSSIPYEIVYN